MSGAAEWISPTALYRAIVAAFLATHTRPCACDGDGPLDLRAERQSLVCASCDRPYRRVQR